MMIRSFYVLSFFALLCSFTWGAQAQSLTIRQPVITTSPSCNGEFDGTIAVEIDTAGGIALPISFAVIRLSPFETPPLTVVADTNSTTYTFQGLPHGTYIVNVSDDNGVDDQTFATILNTSVVGTNLSSKTDVLCKGETSGAITVTGAGGNGAPYSFSIDGGATFVTNGTTSYTFTGLASGTYNIVARDPNDCTDPTPLVVTIAEPTNGVAFNNISRVDNSSCDGDGQIIVSATGGTPSYNYSIDGGPYTNNNTFSGLLAGTYLISIRDANGCSVDSLVSLGGPSLLQASATTTDALCAGDASGSIQVNVTGGTAPFIYSIDNGATFQLPNVFGGLTAGAYTIIVQDNIGCRDTITGLSISEPVVVQLTLDATTNIAGCAGDANGAFTVSATGGAGSYEYALNGGAFGTDATFSGLTAGTYQVVARDANGCTDTLSNIQITEPAAVQLSLVSTTNIAGCAGDASGEIAVSTTGGTGSYEYALNGGAFGTDATFSGLTAGTYQVVARDANGCTDTLANIQITEPAAVQLALDATTNVACAGDASGEIAVSTTGGTGSYEYALNGGAFGTDATFSNLTAGTYQVVARDANGCTDTLSNIQITEPAAVQLSLVSTTNIAGCAGDASGEIAVSTTGGTGSYEYALNGGAFGTSSTFTNLTAGTYQVVARDANGCTDTLSNIQITEPAAVQVALDALQNVTGCTGGSTGEIAVSTTGGTGSYEYALNGGAFGTSSTFTNLTAGTYQVVARDANGCTDTLSNIQITEPAAVQLSLVSTTNIAGCAGDATGEIAVSTTGGTGSYEYALNGGAFGTNATFSNLTAGTYQVVARDANGCTDTLSNIQITEPAAVQLSPLSLTNPTCNGDATGSITVAASGGAGSYEYALNGGAFGTSSTFTNLTAGTYEVVARDANGCTDTLANIPLTEPAAVVLSLANTTDIAGCAGDATGAFTVSATGGNGTYEYALNGGAFGASETFSGLMAGTYQVVARDGNGCTDTLANIQITEPAAVQLTLVNTVDITCNSESTGSFTVATTGGTGSYEYALNGGAFGTDATFSSLTAGTYQVVARDANGCTDTLSNIQITEPAAVQVALDATTNVACAGDASGEIAVSTTGGTGSYEYALNGGAFGTSSTFTNLTAGTYQVVARDANGCTDTLSNVQITEPAAVQLSLVSTTNIAGCAGDATGEIAVSTTGGTGSYEYALNGGAFGTNATFSNLTAGTYQVVARDANGCTDTLANIQITEPAAVQLALVSTTNIAGCAGDATGEITVSVAGGTAAYQYSINGGAFATDSLFTSLTAGTYEVVVRDANGCTDTLSAIQLSEPNAVQVALTGTTPVTGCNGNSDGSITVAATGGVGSYEFSLNGGAFGTDVTFANLTAGTYEVVARDANGCTDTLANIQVDEPIALDLTLVAQTNVAGCTGDATGSFTVAVTGGTAGYQFSLNGGAFGTDSIFTNLPAGSYQVVVQDVNGCTDTLSSIQLTEPAPLALTLVSSQDITTCAGDATGSITVAIAGGTSGYEYALNGGAFGTDSVFTSLTAGTYEVVVRDAAGCTDTLTGVTLTEPAAMTLSLVSSSDVTGCAGDANGSFTVALTGGTAAYQYSINSGAFATDSIFNNLTAGTYEVIARDASGCTDTLSNIQIAEPAAVQLALVSIQNVGGCSGATTGSISVATTGGVGNYEYAFEGGAFGTDSVFSNLSVGSYEVIVRDANGCTDTLSNIQITEPAPLAISLVNATNITGCAGDATGELTVAVTGGTAAYQYSINGGAFDTDSIFTSLTAGTYEVVVRDANGCTDTLANVQITEPVAIQLALVNVQNVSGCAGDASGEISVSATGGTGSYEYSLNGGAYGNNNTFSNLTDGTYEVVVRDASGCADTLSDIIITAPNSVQLAQGDVTHVTGCTGNTNGSFSVMATGGTLPYAYSLNGAAFGTDSVFTNLGAGNYSVTIRDQNGCTDVFSISIEEPDAVTLTFIDKTDFSLCTGVGGDITVSAAGGTGPYDFTLNGISNGTDSTFTNLSAGTYEVIARDTKGCADTLSVTIDEAQPVQLALVSAFDATCAGLANGEIRVEATQGVGNYEYAIAGGVYNTSPILTGLTAGTYDIVVRDGAGCPDTLFGIVIAEPAPLALSLTDVQNTTCGGAPTGSIEVATSGGTAPYFYSINGGSFGNDSVFTDLAAGVYDVVVNDAAGCSDTLAGITIDMPGAFTITDTLLTQPSGCGQADGAIAFVLSDDTNIQVTGDLTALSSTNLSAGTYTATLTDTVTLCSRTVTVVLTDPMFSLTGLQIVTTDVTRCDSPNGAIQISLDDTTQATLSGDLAFFENTGLSAGSYQITLTDKNTTCTWDTTVTLAPVAPFTVVASVSDVSACGTQDGAITLTLSGGSGSFSFAGDLSAATTTALDSGTYQVTITDLNSGCQLDTAFTIQGCTTTPGCTLTASATLTDVTTCSLPDGTITITTSGGTAPLEYALNGSAFGPAASFSNLTAGTYQVIVRDATGCSVTLAGLVLTDPTAPQLTLARRQHLTGCDGTPNGQLVVAVTGGTAPYEYALGNGAFGPDSIFANLPVGTYSIVVRDANGCQAALDTLRLINQDAPTLSLVALNDATGCDGTDGSLHVAAAGGAGDYRFALNNGVFASDSVFTNLAAGTYQVSVRDANGCTTTLADLVIRNQNAPLISLVATSNPTGCAGATDGSITVSTTGGAGSYTYSLNGMATPDSVFTNLTAGSYEVIVTDANGCSDTLQNIVLDTPSAVAIALVDALDPTCNGADNGLIRVSTTGGQGNYQYSLNGGLFTADSVFANLTPGTYTILVRDAAGCQDTLRGITLAEPLALQIALVATQDDSCGVTPSGLIRVSATGGTEPYTYALDGGSFGADSTFTGLTAGTYDVTVRDAQGCTTTLPDITLSTPATFTVDVAKQEPSCSNNDGSITLLVSDTTNKQVSGDLVAFSTSGLAEGTYNAVVTDLINNCRQTVSITLSTPPANFLSDIQIQAPTTCNGTDGVVSFAFNSLDVVVTGDLTSDNTTDLASGSYFVVLLDTVTGCSLDTTVVVPAAPVPFTVNATITATSDCGQADGSIQLSMMGGSGSFSFAGDLTAATTTNLAEGTYRVSITDQVSGCVLDTSFYVTGCVTTCTLIASVDSVPPTGCSNANGSITVNTSGGVAPFRYALNNGVFGTNNVFTDLPTGVYSVTVRDAQGCLVEITDISLMPPSMFTVDVVTQAASCGASDGAIFLEVADTTDMTVSGDLTAFSTTGLPAGAYNVVVTDVSTTCQRSLSITLDATDPAFLTDVQTQAPTTCNGGDGSVTFTVSNTNVVVTGDLTALSNTALTAGSYTVQLTDTLTNCVLDTTVVVPNAPAPFTVVASVSDVSACGTQDGAITLTLSGGSGSFSFAGDLSAATTTALDSGTYQVTITDLSSGCQLDTAFTIQGCTTTPGCTLTASATLTDVTTCSLPDGTITITTSGGTAPLEYALNGSAFGPAASFSNLTAGTYQVIVRDATGCSVTLAGLVLTDPTAPQLTLARRQHLTGCDGTPNGQLVVAVTGGTAPYEYALGNGAFGPDSIFANLPVGTYSIVVRDANGCQAALDTLRLINQDAPTLSLVALNDATGCDGTDGSLHVAAAGGAGDYRFALNNGVFASDSVFTNLAAGTYQVSVRDANGCTTTLADLVIRNQDAPLISLADLRQPNCNGDSAFFAVSSTGGVAPYQYALNGGTFGSDSIFTNLTAGSYEVIVQDANGCVDTLRNVVIDNASPIAMTLVSTTQLTCDGNADGEIVVSVTGGTGAYSFLINGVASSNSTFRNLAAGTYQIVVTDEAGCSTALNNIVLAEPTAIDLTLAESFSSVCGGATGQFSVAVAGGAAPYEYALNGGTFGPDSVFTDLAAGFYNVTVRDQNGCTTTLSDVTIAAPGNFWYELDVQSPTTCDASNGFININIGGTAASNIVVSGDLSSLTNANLPQGVYRVLLTDTTTGCSLVAKATLAAPAAQFLAEVVAKNPSACGNTNGSIRFVVADSSNMQVTGDLTALTTTGLASGTYAVTLFDANTGCQIDTVVTLQDGPAPFTVRATIQPVADCSNPDGSITLNVTGGSGDYLFSGDLTAATTTGLREGNYRVTITDAISGCVTDTTFLIGGCSIPCALSVSADLTPVSGCETANGEINAQATGGTAPYTFTLNTGARNTTGRFTGLSEGTYVLFVRDAAGCTDTLTDINLGNPTAPSLRLVSTQNASSCTGTANDGQITVTTDGGQAPYRYFLNGQAANSNVFRNLTAGTYQVVVVDTLGCSDTLGNIRVGNSGPNFTVTRSINNVTSCGGTDGRITPSINGVGPFSYLWSGVGIQPGKENQLVQSNLPAGTYRLVVTHTASGCTREATFTVLEPTNCGGNGGGCTPTATIVIVSPTACSDINDGTITVTQVGGTGPFGYSIGNAYTSDTVYTGIQPGTYTVAVYDSATGCEYTTQINVVREASFEFQAAVVKQVSCAGGNDGAIAVTALTEGKTMVYAIDNLDPSSFKAVKAGDTITGLNAGRHTLYLRDASNNACIKDTSFQITQPEALVATVAATQLSQCATPTGKAKLNGVAGGTAPYRYYIGSRQVGVSPQNGVFTKLSNGQDTLLAAGDYTLTVVDAKNCATQVAFRIDADGPTINKFLLINPACSGGLNGEIRITEVSGGTGPYRYSLNGGAYQESGVFTGLAAGDYTIRVQDVSGCPRAFDYTLTSPEAITFKTSFTPTSCALNDGTITVTGFTHGVAPYFVIINREDTLMALNQDDEVKFSRLTSGVYTIEVVDQSNRGTGCRATRDVAVSGYEGFTFTHSNTHVNCFGDASGTITIENLRGLGPFSITAKNRQGQVVFQDTTSAGTHPIFGLTAGQYAVTIKQLTECEDQTAITFLDTIQGPAQPIKLHWRAVAPSYNDLPQGRIKIDSITGGSGGPYWIRVDGTAEQRIFANERGVYDTLLIGLLPRNYQILVRDELGCYQEFTATVVADDSFVIPNVFTPNGDGKNDKFYLSNLPVGTAVFIYNRWGKLVYKNGDYDNQWEGEGLLEGTYFYSIRHPTLGLLKGWVQIRR
ncbi:gliding motility-associated C-terminal domain-containing protein [Catalinimonas alkaloidigena]|uniref:Gliding motility-associated C-terminal domain-containing protein n=1 Tax=Catalinimonas alkaloidigena TaxID=1075417 RepID=A0A1G9DA56_9BACT|nr:gliding motility-associated C-terminal domain-containing protein [Catalinimonas alkaloidigena]SDK60772.1 gliding motility-associated C-terminal domain-containing protein [Catalinimonas alkaloidigena]